MFRSNDTSLFVVWRWSLSIICFGFSVCVLSLSTSGLYLHLPFCRRRCFYCDFPIAVVGDSPTAQRSASEQYLQLLKSELALMASVLPERLQLETVYMGGGTPSLFPDQCNPSPVLLSRFSPGALSLIGLHELLAVISQQFPLSPHAEVTLEMDPGTFSLPRLHRIQEMGVNRISLGVQSFDEAMLRRCGRAHSANDVFAAVEALHASGFVNFNIDLISGLPGLSIELWQRTLEQAVDCQSRHLSVYDLQVEEKTAFGRWYAAGATPLPTEESAAAMFRQAASFLTLHHFEHYEVSNYAKYKSGTTSGNSAPKVDDSGNRSASDQSSFRSRHNQRYWRNEPVLALGMGAASYYRHHRFTRPATLSAYQEWLRQCEAMPARYAEHLGLENNPRLTADVLETVMLSLRTADGLDITDIEQSHGLIHSAAIEVVMEKYEQSGWTQKHGRRWRLTDPEGFLRSNSIISDIFMALDEE